MLVEGVNMHKINHLKALLTREFELKDLGGANYILGMSIHRDKENMKIWLSQKSYMEKVMHHFNV